MAITTPPGRLVMATGVFDILHVEHVRLLKFAATLGNYLLVAINSDESVRRIKGPHRPIIGQNHRMEMVKALACVDEVMLFREDTPLELIGRRCPDILVKGHDYLGKRVPEAEILKEWGGRLVIAPTTPRESTTSIINRIRSTP